MTNHSIVFMGSPSFAVPVLETLNRQFRVSGVVTQPDKPAGRGRELRPCPVKEAALGLGLPVIQPEKLRGNVDAIEQIRHWNPAVIVVAAYGKILRRELLDLPVFGCINVHASLLPRWRGASPMQAAILSGDALTGVTIMQMAEGMDTGPMLNQASIPIGEGETTESLEPRLASLGAELLAETLPAYLNGDLRPISQPETGITYAPLLKKEDGALDFTKPVDAL
ncbi:MAG: methionyl-tRNA formyltransferase, partial [Anaerolineaceae bacterium]